MKVSEARKNILKFVGDAHTDDMGNTVYSGKAVDVPSFKVGLTEYELDRVLDIMEDAGEVKVKHHSFTGLSLFMVTLTEYGFKVHQTHFIVKMKING